MKISIDHNKISTCHYENLDLSSLEYISIFGQNSVPQDPLYIAALVLNSVFGEKNIIFSSLSQICHFFLRIPTCFGKFFKPFPSRRNFTMSTTQNKGRFGFMAFQTFGTKAIKSNEETEVLIAMLSKESMAKISLNIEDKYL